MDKSSAKYFLLAFVVILLMTAIFFGSVLTGKKSLHYGDLSSYFYPFHLYFYSHLKAGELVLWNDLDGTGVPTLPNPQTGLFYPPNWLYFLLPILMAFNYIVVLHFLIAAIGVVLLLRGFRLHWLAAVIGAIAFAFSGTMLSLSNTIDYFEAAAWLPLFLHFSLAIVWQKPSWLRVTGASAFYAMMLLCSVQYSFLAGLLVGLIVVVSLLVRKGEKAGKKFLILSIFAAIALLAFSLAAAQLVSTFKGMQQSLRNEPLSLKEATRISFKPVGLLSLVVPRLFYQMDGQVAVSRQPLFSGDRPTWLLDIYPGLFILLLALLGMVVAPKCHQWLWIAVVAISILFAMAQHLPFYRWLYQYLPMFNRFRYPEKLLLFSALGFAVLAAFGMHRLITDPASLKRSALITLVVIIPLTVLMIWQTVSLQTFTSSALQNVFGFKLSQLGPPALQQLVGQLAPLLIRMKIAAALAVVFGLLLFLRVNRPTKSKGLIAGITVLLLVDIITANRGVVPQVEPGLYTQEPEALRYISLTTPPPRYFEVRNWSVHSTPKAQTALEVGNARVFLHKEELVPDYGMIWGLAAAHPIGVLAGREQDRFMKKMGELPPEKQLPYYNMVNVRYLFSIYPYELPGIVELAKLEKNGYYLYENHNAFGDAYLRAEEIRANSADEAMDKLFSGDVDLTRTVIVEAKNGQSPLPENTTDDFVGTAEISKYRPDEFQVDVKTNRSAHLIFPIAYHSGWSCRGTDGELPMQRANSLLLSTPVEHDDAITCEFRDRSLPLGASLSLFGLIVWGLILVLGIRQKRNEQEQMHKGTEV